MKYWVRRCGFSAKLFMEVWDWSGCFEAVRGLISFWFDQFLAELYQAMMWQPYMYGEAVIFDNCTIGFRSSMIINDMDRSSCELWISRSRLMNFCQFASEVSFSYREGCESVKRGLTLEFLPFCCQWTVLDYDGSRLHERDFWQFSVFLSSEIPKEISDGEWAWERSACSKISAWLWNSWSRLKFDTAWCYSIVPV